MQWCRNSSSNRIKTHQQTAPRNISSLPTPASTPSHSQATLREVFSSSSNNSSQLLGSTSNNSRSRCRLLPPLPECSFNSRNSRPSPQAVRIQFSFSSNSQSVLSSSRRLPVTRAAAPSMSPSISSITSYVRLVPSSSRSNSNPLVVRTVFSSSRRRHSRPSVARAVFSISRTSHSSSRL